MVPEVIQNSSGSRRELERLTEALLGLIVLLLIVENDAEKVPNPRVRWAGLGQFAQNGFGFNRLSVPE